MPHSKKQLAEEAMTEVQKRSQFYPERVRAGKMKQIEADEKIARMRAIYRVIMGASDEQIRDAQGN